MDYKGIALAVVDGDYSHSSIAMARWVLERLDVPVKVQEDIEEMLYAKREFIRSMNRASTAEEA
jgi:hypothetical protein